MQERQFAGKYRAGERLDAGGAREVFRAVDELERPFAVDVLHPGDGVEVLRLDDAMHAVAGIGDPNVPRVYQWGEDEKDYFVVREYVDGWDIESLIARGPLDPLRVARYGAKAAAALESAHRVGIVHGDLRTSSVMVTQVGEVKLLGLGESLPRLVPIDGPAEDAHFLAPELLAGQVPSPSSDVYALGVILYEAATATLPFESGTAGAVAELHATADAEPPRRVNPELPASLEAVIARAMHKDPAERFATAAEMQVALDRVGIQIESGEPDPMPAAGLRLPQWPSWVWWTAAGIAAVLVLGVAVGGLVWWRKSMTVVPSLVGLTPAEARTKIKAAGLAPGAIVFMPVVATGVPEGVITTQTPMPGGWTRVGNQIGVVINGPRKVKVPSVIGAPQASAMATVQASGLRLAGIEVAWNEAPAGQVVSQTPEAGGYAPKGSGILLGVSRGPHVLPIPGVVGEAAASATDVLSKAGFKATSSNQYDDVVPSGSVISQSPTAGSEGNFGSAVAIVVSGGPKPLNVPNVTGQGVGPAVNALQDLGLKVNLSPSSVASSVAGGTQVNPAIGQVLTQSPSAGTSVKFGSSVSLTYGQP